MRNVASKLAATRSLAALLAGLLLTALAGAANLLPPSLSIRLPQNAVALVTIVEVVDAERLRFRRDLVLQEDRALEETGVEPPEEIVVRVGEALVGSVEVGESYILGYTSLAQVEEMRHTYTPDPAGSSIAILPAVGPALLEDSPPLRKLVTPRPTDEELAPRQRLDLILVQLERPDPTGRLFVLAELVLWSDVHGELTDADLTRFRRVLESGELETRAREYYLRAFVPLRERLGMDWLVEECRRVMAENDSELDLLSPHPSLVTLALNTLHQMGEAEDAVGALEFLHSNSDAVSLAAFRAAAALDPDRTEETVGELVLVGDLPLDTEREAIRFLAQRQSARWQAEDSS